MIITGEGKVTIGDNFHSGADCRIITHIHNFDHGEAIPYDSTYIHRDLTIEDNVWLGDQVILLGGITIGEGAIVQAGSVVVSDIPKYAIAGGHPAKVFKSRDVEHYERLKAEGKFH
jgi:acetyltransferase-like isoleucine patch superfamily enzyme